MEKLQVVYRKTDDLIPYARNARVHDEAQITKLAASIKEFGFTLPILIDKKNGVICGHGRLLGAKKVGLDEIPCVVCDGWEDAKKRAYILADNRLTQDSYWDYDMLKIEVEDLKSQGFDFSAIGFDEDEIDKITSNELDDSFFEDVEGDGSFVSFSIALNFPKEYEDEVKAFVKKVGKDAITNKIIQWSKSGQIQ